jgi:RHS repeat-associated protein
MVCEYLANDDPSTTAPQQTYVYGSYVDEPLIKIDSASTKLYYHANRQYSVTAMTDSSGTVVERYAYSPYGVTTILAPNGSTPRATSSVGNSYMYTGRRLDKEFASSSEDAVYYYRARYYLPPLGRFGSRDPLRYADGMSVYGYVKSNPMTNRDPSGTYAVCCHTIQEGEGAGMFTHCEVQKGSCTNDNVSYRAYIDNNPDRRMDNGLSCACATEDDVDKCLLRTPCVPTPLGEPTTVFDRIGNNCHTSTIRQLGNCCLRSAWKPHWYAGTWRGNCTRYVTVWDLSVDPPRPIKNICVEWELPQWHDNNVTPKP